MAIKPHEINGDINKLSLMVVEMYEEVKRLKAKIDDDKDAYDCAEESKAYAEKIRKIMG